jgi:BMFP domain-containing protein YqiC
MPTDYLKKMLFDAATKFMSSERGMKMMQNPKLMQTAAKLFELRGQVKSNVEGSMKRFHAALGLVGADDLEGLRRVMKEIELRLNDLKSQTDDLEASLVRLESERAPEAKNGGKRRGRGDKLEA